MIKNRQINSKLGLLFQIPLWTIALLGLYKLVEILFYSFTDYNMVAPPQFVGLKNYVAIFDDEVIQLCLGNTIVMTCCVAGLLVLTAVLPALFMSKLKLPIGLIVSAAFLCVSICARLTGFLGIFFSSDSRGMLNSFLLNSSLITEPVQFLTRFPTAVVVLVFWLYCLAPVFLITYVAAKMKRGFWGATIALCAVPLFMFWFGNQGAIAGNPSTNYAADWLYTVWDNYVRIRSEIGSAYAILLVGLALWVVWCVVVFFATYGIRAIFKKANTDAQVFKVFGYFTFGRSLALAFVVLFAVAVYLMMAVKPIEEVYAYPSKLMPMYPTLDNFLALFREEFFYVSITNAMTNSLLLVPTRICITCWYVAFPTGVGLAAFRAVKRQKLLFLSFIPLFFVSDYVLLSKLGFANTTFAYAFEFLSSFELVAAIFLAFLTVKLVFGAQRVRAGSILLGIFFLQSSFSAIGVIRGIWCPSSAVFSEWMKGWSSVSSILGAGGISKSGLLAANELLMLLVTLVAVIIPLVLLLVLYLSYKKQEIMNT